MIRAAIVFILFLVPVTDVGAQVRIFENVDNKNIKEAAISGGYIHARPLSSDSTLRVWVEDISRGERPDYSKAHGSDLVVWCFPKRYPHDRHIFPQAVRVGIKPFSQPSSRKKYFIVVDLSREELPEDEEIRSFVRENISR